MHPDMDACLTSACEEYHWASAHLPGVTDLVFERSQLMQRVYNSFKVVFWIDSDICFAPEQLLKAAKLLHDTPKAGVVAAPYVDRKTQQFRTFRPLGKTEFALGPGGRPFPVLATGLGCTAIRTDALRSTTAPTALQDDGSSVNIWCMPYVEGGHYFSEDLALTHRIHKAGWQVMLDPSNEVDHILDNRMNFRKGLANKGQSVPAGPLEITLNPPQWFCESFGSQ